MSNFPDLLTFSWNVNSQYGEDGIIKEILNRLDQKSGWAVEFGAWDGKYLSNIRRLIDEEGYSGVYVEASKKKFKKLFENFRESEKVHCINKFVGFGNNDNLDVILSRTPCSLSPDVLSIDIDGNDIHVWSAITKYRPKIVCIEYNPTIPTKIPFAQPPDPYCKWGASLLSLFEIGAKKNYRLVCANEVNAFFVDAVMWSGTYAKTQDELLKFRKIEPDPIFLFSGYDGTVLLSDKPYLPWHTLRFTNKNLQLLPKYLRKYPDDYSFVARKLFAFFRKYLKRFN